jgi:hypothetical protein
MERSLKALRYRRILGLMANRTVTGPRGSFELIVTKALEMPKWRRNESFDPKGLQLGEPDHSDSEPTTFSTALGNYIVDFFTTMWTNRKATGVRIRAVNWNPPVESYVWTTTKDAVDRVVEEVVEGLEQGKFVQPVGAVFSGDEKRS